MAEKNKKKRIPVSSPRNILAPSIELENLRTKLEVTESVLRTLQAEFSQVLQNDSYGLRIISKDHTIRFINQAFADISGIRPEDAIGKKCWEVFTSPLCHTSECRLQRVQGGEKTVQVEVDRKTQDGTTIPCIVTTSPLTDDTEKFSGIIERFCDISEQYRMKEQFEESEERYRSLIELGTEAGEAIVILQNIDGREGIQTFVNDQWPYITGYSKQELLGKCFFDIVSGEARQASIERHRVKISGKSVPGLYELSILNKDGTPRTIQLTGGYAIFQHKAANVLYIRDITEQKKMEVALQQEKDHYFKLFEHVPVAIIELDCSNAFKIVNTLKAQGIVDIPDYIISHNDICNSFLLGETVLNYNQAFLKLYEVDTRESYSKFFVAEINKFNKNPKSELNFNYLKSLVTSMVNLINGTSEPQINALHTKTRKTKYIQSNYAVMPGHETDFSWIYSISIDITERIKAEQELISYKNQLEDIVRVRTSQLEISHKSLQSEITQNKLTNEQLVISQKKLNEELQRRVYSTRALVHELNTFLTPLIGAGELLDKYATSENLIAVSGTINASVNGLEHRVEELLDLARGETGRLEIHRTFVQPTKLLNRVVESTIPIANKNRQTFKAEIPDSLPQLWADEERLTQITLNLLNNAFKYTPEGGHIWLCAWIKAQSLYVEVSDDGPGIAAVRLSTIFDAYHPNEVVQGERRISSLGIGLPLAKMLAELHGGCIDVKSQPGQGAVFTLVLPYKNLSK